MAMGTGQICNALHGLKPVLLMVVVQFAFAGVNVLYKLAANDGMNLSILVAYRFIFGTAFLLPIALFFERKNRPKLTWMVLLQGFLSGLFGGSLSQNLYIESLSLNIGHICFCHSPTHPGYYFHLGNHLQAGEVEFEKPNREGKGGGNIDGNRWSNASGIL
ncbi:hypothetical protein ACFXTN_007617 [Malus domestica]